MSGLEDAWGLLRAESRPEPGWHGRRVHPEAVCRLQAAIRQPDGVRGLLLEVQAAAIPAGVEWPDCAGFLLTPAPLSGGASGRVRLVLEERSPVYAELFGVVADNVAACAAAAGSEPAAVAAVAGRLAAWQRFMERHGPGRLSEEARVGLAAELIFLETVVLARLPATEAVTAWRGPTGAPQDFRFPACLVEVKGSVAATPSSFRVSNLDQLSGDAGLALFLCHQSLSSSGPGARTLPALVADIRAAAAGGGAAAGQLEDLLFEAGWLDAHAPGYSVQLYAPSGLRCFRVEDGFPRLTPGGVPPGVSAAVYSVLLSACTPFETTLAACADLIGNPHV